MLILAKLTQNKKMIEKHPGAHEESKPHQQEQVGQFIGPLLTERAATQQNSTTPEHLDTEPHEDMFHMKFETQKAHLERIKHSRMSRLDQIKERLEQRAEEYEEKRGSPPSEEWLARFTAPAENAIKITEKQLEFLRPTSEDDIAYRRSVIEELPSKIKAAAPPDLPLRFHGTSIYTAKDIFNSKGISSSVDRLGVETSYDAADQVSVTTPDTIRVSLDSYSGLTEENYCVPAGCVFVLLPSSQLEADAGSSMLMGNVDFATHPEQLFAVMTSDENVDSVKKWAHDSGIDTGKIMEFFDFAEKLSEVKSSFEQGTASAEEYVQYLKHSKVLTKEYMDTSQQYDSESREAGWDSPERVQKLVESYILPGTKVLDIGIGTGQAVKGYAEKGATVIGLDHDQKMLDLARVVSGDDSSLRIADINQPLPTNDLEGMIDVAQAVGVLEFSEDLKSILAQVNKSLRQNGVFAFTTESLEKDAAVIETSTHYPDTNTTVYRHSPDEIKELLHETGYTLLSDEAYGGYYRGDIPDGKVPYHIFLAQKT